MTTTKTTSEKRAEVSYNGAGRWHVVFGRNDRGAFLVSAAKPSRFYASEKGARKAASTWCAS